MTWNPICIAFGIVYLAGMVVAGIRSASHSGDSNQYLNATSSLPLWICATACIAANCGSLDIFAMMALGAQYGMLACHFYWIGAIPALLAVAFWLLPIYKRNRHPTILDFIERHYGNSTRLMVALCMAAMMLLIAGVGLYAVAETASAFLGWSFIRGILLAATVVLVYTWIGGFRATVYTELIHFALVLAAVIPLLFLVARELGGFRGMIADIPASRLHTWQGMPLFAPHAVMDRVGVVFGLGLVLSFGYWGTDFVQMQRALAVRCEEDAPFVPLSVGFAKLIFAVLIAMTGVAAPLVLSRTRLSGNWNATLPALMLHYYGPAWLGMGFMGLAASLLSTFSNNIAGFTSAWVQGIYQKWIHPEGSDAHYKRVSRATMAAAVLLSVGAAYFALGFESLMEYIQLVLSTFNAPLFALVALTAIAPRRAAQGGSAGFVIGLVCAVVHQILVLTHALHYGSQLSANFYGAILGFVTAFAATLSIGWFGTYENGVSRVQTGSAARSRLPSQRALVAGIVLAGLLITFSVIFW